jgi:hypothetical protein
MSTKNDVALNFLIPRTLLESLRDYKERTGSPVSETVRRAIFEFLDARNALRWRPEDEGSRRSSKEDKSDDKFVATSDAIVVVKAGRRRKPRAN